MVVGTAWSAAYGSLLGGVYREAASFHSTRLDTANSYTSSSWKKMCFSPNQVADHTRGEAPWWGYSRLDVLPPHSSSFPFLLPSCVISLPPASPSFHSAFLLSCIEQALS